MSYNTGFEFYILLPVFMYYIFKKHKEIILLILIVVLLYYARVSVFELKTIDIQESYKVKVIGSITQKNKTSFVGKLNGSKVMVYLDYYDDEILPGDRLEVKGIIESPIESTIPGTFNYKNYLKSKNIKNILYVEEHTVVSHSFSIETIRAKISEYIDVNMPLSSAYVKTFILADKSEFDTDFKEKLNYLGVSHLFAVSGLHVGLVILVVKSVSDRYFSKSIGNILLFILLPTYMLCANSTSSILRATLMYGGYVIREKYKLRISSLDILSIIFIGLLMYRPYYYYDVGFVLSFVVTCSILMSKYLLKNVEKNTTIIRITLIAFIVTLPIILKLNYRINLTTLFINIILIYYMTFIILPMGYITFAIPTLDRLYYAFIEMFEYVIVLVSNINVFSVYITITSTIQIMIYYFLVFMLTAYWCSKRVRIKLIYVLLLFVLLTINSSLIQPIQSVNMIDLYGDSILIVDSFDQCNILIDTGDSDDYDSVENFIRYKNVKRLDYLILTHNHDDHMGESQDIISLLDVRHIIDSTNGTEYDELICGKLKLQFFEFSNTYNEVNNSSLVFTLQISDRLYLFTGDMEKEKEEEFIELYDVDVDYLKSGHHGSITSSSELFLDDIMAESVLISCYRNNLHGHPHDVVIERYDNRNMEIFRTDLLGTIEIRYVFGKEYKKFNKP